MVSSVLVTGATGAIGPSVVHAVHNAGARIRTFSCDSPAAGLFPFPLEIVTGDIADKAAVHAAMRGMDAVIHLAARNHVLKETAKNPLSEYRKVNVEGTRNIIRAAADSGVKYFIHLSSVKAMREESGEVLAEDSPCSPKTPYGISKLESEETVRLGAAKNGMNAVILRLPMVYGPRNKGNLPRLIRWAERGLPFPLFQPDNLRSMVYVENVVAGLMAVLKNAPAGVSTYMLKDNEDCSTGTLYSAICRELGKNPRFVRIPAGIVKLGGTLSEDFRKITGSLRISSGKIEKEIGFVPPVTFEEGISRTVRWHKGSAC